MYHENVHLILHKLSKYTNLAGTFDEFVSQLTCNNSIKAFFYRKCKDCKDSFDFFVPPSDVADIGTKYRQWQTGRESSNQCNCWDIFEDVKSQLIFSYIVMQNELKNPKWKI